MSLTSRQAELANGNDTKEKKDQRMVIEDGKGFADMLELRRRIFVEGKGLKRVKL